MENTATIPAQAKEVCNRSVTYQPALARNPRESILALSVNNYFWHLMYKLFDQKRLQIIYKLIWHHLYRLFSTKKWVPECKPEPYRESLTFSPDFLA